MWRDQLGLDGLRTITFDKRGFGRTPLPPEPFSDTADAIEILDHLEVHSAIIVGCSMGGETALDLAIRHLERVKALVLIGAIPNGWEPDDGWNRSNGRQKRQSLPRPVISNAWSKSSS